MLYFPPFKIYFFQYYFSSSYKHFSFCSGGSRPGSCSFATWFKLHSCEASLCYNIKAKRCCIQVETQQNCVATSCRLQ